VDLADLMAAQGAFGTDFYDRSTRRIVGTMLWTEQVFKFFLRKTTYYKLKLSTQETSEALNDDDLLSKFDDRIKSTDKQLLDCPNNVPDAILRIMFSGRHINVNWTI